MNSFETDIKRAFCSIGFWTAFLGQILILCTAGAQSDLFYMTHPVLCTFPYTTAWLADYQSGYIKAYLPRTGKTAYITGKFLACGLAGGAAQAAGCAVYLLLFEKPVEMMPGLIFISGMFWAQLGAVLSAVSNSRCIAYGGPFVIYYLAVILHERYFQNLYCLYPYEWLLPQHEWIFGTEGVYILTGGLILVLYCLYQQVLRRYMEYV